MAALYLATGANNLVIWAAECMEFRGPYFYTLITAPMEIFFSNTAEEHHHTFSL